MVPRTDCSGAKFFFFFSVAPCQLKFYNSMIRYMMRIFATDSRRSACENLMVEDLLEWSCRHKPICLLNKAKPTHSLKLEIESENVG